MALHLAAITNEQKKKKKDEKLSNEFIRWGVPTVFLVVDLAEEINYWIR